MIHRAINRLRQLRIRVLMARGLSNWREVSAAYSRGAAPPPLRLRTGTVIHHQPGDSPVFLFLEIFANGCYRRRFGRVGHGAIVDIGANIGMFAIDCATRYPHARIHAYEPNPATFHTLERNIAANGLADRVRLFNEAVGRRPGLLRLWQSDGSIAATGYPTADDERSRSLDVPQIDLATVVRRAGGRVGVLKIDAEGAEADILEGAPGGVFAGIDQVIGEYHESRVPGVLARSRAALEAAGFTVDARARLRSGPLFHARRSTA